MLDQKRLDRAVEDISELISLAPMGLAEWGDIPRMMTELFPGSFSGLQNFDLINNCLPFLEVDGLEEHHLQDYANYYYAINPYEEYWRGHGDGQVWISDHVIAIADVKKTEFYNDWMGQIGDFDSAIGVKLDPVAENEFRFNLQFPTRYLDKYGPASGEIMSRLRAPFYRAVTLAHHFDEQQIRTASLSALLDRKDKAACVMDYGGRLQDANGLFEYMLANGDLFKIEFGALTLRDSRLAPRFINLAHDMAFHASSQGSRMVVRGEGAEWVLSFTHLPVPQQSGITLQRPLVLVVVTKFGSADEALDLGEFAFAFGLTSAEGRLCQYLAMGQSLSDAAVSSGISYETARSRLKTIFQKTGKSRQSDLLLMLEQFRLG